MTATPSPKGIEPKEPEPTLLDLFLQSHLPGCNLTPCNCGHDKVIQFIATLTAERDEAQKRAEVAEAAVKSMQEAQDKFAESFKRNENGNIRALSALFEARPPRLETDLGVRSEDKLPTA